MTSVLLTNFHPHGGGGHVPYIQALTRLHDQQGLRIGVATPASSRLYQYLAAAQYPHLYACDFPAKLQKEPRAIWAAIGRFRRTVADFKPDIVHCNGAADLFIANLSRPGLGYQLVRTHHAIRQLKPHWYHRWLYQGVTAANIYVSQGALALSCHNGLQPQPVEVIENGVDLQAFQPQPADPQLRQQWGLQEDELCIGSCAGTGDYKRVDLMIEAAMAAKAALPQRRFRIMVLGEPRSGKALEQQAHARGLTEFHYLGFHQDIRPYIALFDLGFILSDRIETISFAAREMMAMGKPLLSSDYAGLKDNISHGVDGWLTPAGDLHAITQQLIQCLQLAPPQWQQYSQAARHKAEQRFSIQLQLARHAQLYQRLVTP
ncbi:glycosyltransferase family 4 protein [Balneatrix alpica]|uniref:glycosyltransferase family 4 protein n=1 Tax=Balneatrix alpica TaxID=75684 RepID=UPI0027391962|nr:glycosyltransferase family 4 protein [Balneatrix alpica]